MLTYDFLTKFHRYLQCFSNLFSMFRFHSDFVLCVRKVGLYILRGSFLSFVKLLKIFSEKTLGVIIKSLQLGGEAKEVADISYPHQ